MPPTTKTRPTAPTLRLRPWQRAALDQFNASDENDFLAVATPGAGKTTFALAAVRGFLAANPTARVIVVAPTSHLKLQWADAAARLGLDLEPSWSASHESLPNEADGLVTTYQQVSTSARVLSKLSKNAIVVFDEVHHAGEDRSWGESITVAFAGALRRLSISGTPFRSDTSAIPFVRYEYEQAVSDFDYGYGPALADGGVVRPIYFPRFDGYMEWSAPDGSVLGASFDDELDRTRANQRLRTALSAQGDWLPAVIAQAHEQLMRIRSDDQPDAGGLIIAVDHEHARAIAHILKVRHNSPATVVLSDDPNASDRIVAFGVGTRPWIVAVRMVSEGVDIPRLRVGVFATTTTTELFFRQAVGRLVRLTQGGGPQRAFMFIPDDARLRAWAEQIKRQRRHSLRARSESEEFASDAEFDSQAEPDDGEQLSLFNALSAVTLSSGAPEMTVFDAAYEDIPEPRNLGVDEADLLFDLSPLPGRGERLIDPNGAAPRREREILRDKNATAVRELVALTGQQHGEVNAELNRRSGVSKVAQASRAQLRKRLLAADGWRRQLSGQRSPWRVR
ncbi:MAG: DEAD/DEAH box helicase [Actinobacteria bacterium]|nr:DEAD/DEAH box helicase [Actinomycetota bacterium]